MKTMDQVVFISHTHALLQLYTIVRNHITNNTNSNHVWSELYGIVFVRVCG